MTTKPIILIHEVTLQRLSDETLIGATGEDLDEWVSVGVYPAYVTSLQGRELVNAKETVAQASHNIRMRVIGPITEADRFLFDGRVFGISSVMRDDERPVFYNIITYEKRGEQP